MTEPEMLCDGCGKIKPIVEPTEDGRALLCSECIKIRIMIGRRFALMTNKNVLWNKRDELNQELSDLENQILFNSGWKHTSATPNSYWRWTKEINGITYMMSFKDALEIQQCLDYDV